MKCPDCVAEGKESRVFPLFGPFYDEHGTCFGLDPRVANGHYSCSRGHYWPQRWNDSPITKGA